MPRIYELPASAGVENRSLEIRHDPGTAPGFRQQPQQPQPGSANPRQMLANQMDMELNNVTREFDVNTSALDQQMLEPDKYKAQYANLQRRANNQRIAIQAKHEAVAQQIKNMQKLVEDRMMSPEQMQATMLVMAGVPSTHVKAMFAQVQRQKPSTMLNEIDSQLKKIASFVDQFDDYRDDPWWKLGKKGTIWFTPKIGGKETGIRRQIKEDEELRLLEALDNAKSRAAELRQAQQEIFKIMTPMEQYAQRGSRALERWGMGYEPPQRALGIGDMRFEEPAPKKKQELTAAELRKQGTEEAYEKGIKLGYWN